MPVLLYMNTLNLTYLSNRQLVLKKRVLKILKIEFYNLKKKNYVLNRLIHCLASRLMFLLILFHFDYVYLLFIYKNNKNLLFSIIFTSFSIKTNKNVLNLDFLLMDRLLSCKILNYLSSLTTVLHFPEILRGGWGVWNIGRRS